MQSIFEPAFGLEPAVLGTPVHTISLLNTNSIEEMDFRLFIRQWNEPERDEDLKRIAEETAD